jgi:hypothetical protein
MPQSALKYRRDTLNTLAVFFISFFWETNSTDGIATSLSFE